MKGIVTMEDILEEIVGKIQDEYDSEDEELILQLEENTYLVKGQTSIKEINRELSLDLPSNGNYTTIAGFFLNEFRKIPQKGDILNYKGHKFVVAEMLERFIAQIRIEIRQHKKLHYRRNIS